MGALKEEENCTDTNTEKRLCEDTERRWPYTSQGEGVSGKPSSAHTSISDRWLPELRVNSFLLLKPASLWYFIRTALQINTSSLSCFLLFVGFDSRTCCIYSLKCLPPPPHRPSPGSPSLMLPLSAPESLSLTVQAEWGVPAWDFQVILGLFLGLQGVLLIGTLCFYVSLSPRELFEGRQSTIHLCVLHR